METVVCEERSHLRRLVGMVVVRELGEGKEVDPIGLVVRDVCAEVCFERLIGALRETVGLRVVRGRVLVIDLEFISKLH